MKEYSTSPLASEEVEKKVLSEIFKDITPKERKAVKKIVFKLVFLCKLKERAKKAEKRLKDRKMRFQELVDGERKYTQGLEDYIKYIKKPIEALKILSQD